MEKIVVVVLAVLAAASLIASAQKTTTEFVGNFESVCIQNPPDYGCDSIDPVTRHDGNVLVIESQELRADITWTDGFSEDAEFRGTGRTSLRCENPDCSLHDGRNTGTFTVFFGDGAFTATYRGRSSDGTFIGTFTITEGEGSLLGAKGKGSYALSSTTGFIEGTIST